MSPTKTTTTDYIDGFEYHDDTLQLFPTEDGRVRYVQAHGTTPASYVYDYFVRDHLGNVRVVLTEQTDFSQYMATMEPANDQTEEALFSNISSTREAKPADYPEDDVTSPNTSVARLNGKDPNRRIGPSIILKVMAGDTIEAGVHAFYGKKATPENNAAVPAADMLADLLATLAAPAGTGLSHEAMATMRTNPHINLTTADLSQLKNKVANVNSQDKPKAYLNYVFFDNRFNFVSDGSGVKQVDGDPGQLETLATGQVVAKKDGYVYVYTSNESQQDVLFDNMSVMQITGPVLEETHYYPFGLTMAGISTVAPLKLEGKRKFNGIEFNHKEFGDGRGLELYTAQYRGLDPQIGRWWQIDPKVEHGQYDESPYLSMDDNPVLRFDPDGHIACCSFSAAWYDMKTAGKVSGIVEIVGGGPEDPAADVAAGAVDAAGLVKAAVDFFTKDDNSDPGNSQSSQDKSNEKKSSDSEKPKSKTPNPNGRLGVNSIRQKLRMLRIDWKRMVIKLMGEEEKKKKNICRQMTEVKKAQIM